MLQPDLPSQELLGHCVEVYKDSRRALEDLEAHLAKYGYAEEFESREPADPLSLVVQRTAAAGKSQVSSVLSSAIFTVAILADTIAIWLQSWTIQECGRIGRYGTSL